MKRKQFRPRFEPVLPIPFPLSNYKQFLKSQFFIPSEFDFGWLVVWVSWHINLCKLFNAKSIFMKIVLFQTIQLSISTQFKCKYGLIVKNSILIIIYIFFPFLYYEYWCIIS